MLLTLFSGISRILQQTCEPISQESGSAGLNLLQVFVQKPPLSFHLMPR